ncbi:recombinase family protein [Schumannella soli]|uniref:recombinase family protein n=1 Tax=Schumannella soli TaxID=2590779 RepID=UPI0021055D5A|nr:recombinase family protein [Schumannella soli]
MQRQECRRLAKELGLTVSREYVDNDVSATSGRVRPQFERLLSDAPPSIIAWHQDRLLRLTADLERVIALDVPIYTVSAGTLDLATPAGRAVARTIAAWSTYEGEQKVARQRAKNAHRVASGLPLSGNRPFGFELDRMTPRESEAERVRWAYAEVLAGASLGAVARSLTDQGVLTSRGREWSVQTLRQLLLRPSSAGILLRDGKPQPKSQITALVDPETFDAVGAILRDPGRRRGPGTRVRSAVLAGIARCAVCDEPMRSGANKQRGVTVQLYRCDRKGGGAHPQIRRHKLERAVETAMFEELTQRQGREVSRPDESMSALRAEREEILRRRSIAQQVIEEPGADVPAGLARIRELGEQADAVQARLDALIAADAESALLDTLAGMAGSWAAGREFYEDAVEEFALEWRRRPIDQRRALIRSALTITVQPASTGRPIVIERRERRSMELLDTAD